MFAKKKKAQEEPAIILDKDDYIDSLRHELLYLIERKLSPIAIKYQYSTVPLESKIKWKSTVLVLGNYSSGKSTLINEFIGAKVQTTGQAPTDDAFTIITCDDDDAKLEHLADGAVYEVRDGHVLLNDEQYPFEVLRKYGDSFAAHFRLKKVKSRVLRKLVIIDTPGMLDAPSDKNRPYDYQGVIGDLAMLSDLVLVLFDPHKAATIKESHLSLRQTLPEKTFEDRITFVLNRIDECSSLEDLLRVYGTLCWNLSAMTGRKDMPRVLLGYSPSVALIKNPGASSFLHLLENQRHELNRIMLEAPRHRLDHLASFVEFHSRRLRHFLQELLEYRRAARTFYLRGVLLGLLGVASLGSAGAFYAYLEEPWGLTGLRNIALVMGGLALVLYLSFQLFILRALATWKNAQLLRALEERGAFEQADRNETWHHIKPKLLNYLKSDLSPVSLSTLRKELDAIEAVHNKGAKEIRTAINRISDLPVC